MLRFQIAPSGGRGGARIVAAGGEVVPSKWLLKVSCVCECLCTLATHVPVDLCVHVRECGHISVSRVLVQECVRVIV